MNLNVRRLLLLGVLFACSCLSPAVLALEVRGVVFEDRNANGTRDAGEPGLAAIRVSNGQEIVRTDDEGRYALTIDGRRGHVMVLKPAGFDYPRNAFGLPEYSWLHYPAGSPKRTFDGIAPTGPVPDSVDFALIPSEKASATLRLLVMADPQTTDERQLGFFERRFTPELQALEDIDFALLLGDQVNDDLDLMAPFDRVVSNFGHPWVAVIGNHDLDLDADSDFGAADTFTGRYGPATWAFEEGPAHFIVMDNIRFYMPPSGEYGYHGGFRTEQLDFVQRYLAEVPKDAMIVLAMHIPMSSRSFRPQDRERLLSLVAPYDNVLLLVGHTHENTHSYLDERFGWPLADGYLHEHAVGTASGGWWGGALDENGLPDAIMRDGTPPGYAILTLEADRYAIEYRAVNQPGRQVALFGPGAVMADTYPNAYVYANVFNGDRYTDVEHQLERLSSTGQATVVRDWSPMQKVDMPDPRVWQKVIERMQQGGEPENARLSHPRDSSHLWRTRLSTDMEPGRYRMRIRAADRWGMNSEEQTEFQVYPHVR